MFGYASRQPLFGVYAFMFVAMLVATVMLADTTTAAQAAVTPPAPAAETAPPAKKKADSDMVCRSEPVLGSRLPQKKCRTSAQAAQDKLDAQADLARSQGANANNPH
jgi:hypothetical protein